MTMKEKIIEILRGNKYTVKEITQKVNKKYNINTNENKVRVYINRLKQKNLIGKCGIDNRYKIYKLVSDSNSNIDTQILRKFLPIFIDLEVKLENTTEKEAKRILELIKECQLI